MRNILPVPILALALLAACQSADRKSSSSDSNGKDFLTAETKQCYYYIKDKDTATLNLDRSNDQVKGVLSYKLYEKDANNGVIAGIVRGDTIIADYTFQSEGATSIRQVVWLKQDNNLIEGFGDIHEVNGKTVFKNISSLNFEKAMVFTKTDCK